MHEETIDRTRSRAARLTGFMFLFNYAVNVFPVPPRPHRGSRNETALERK